MSRTSGITLCERPPCRICQICTHSSQVSGMNLAASESESDPHVFLLLRFSPSDPLSTPRMSLIKLHFPDFEES